jgi:hypothetical protein
MVECLLVLANPARAGFDPQTTKKKTKQKHSSDGFKVYTCQNLLDYMPKYHSLFSINYASIRLLRKIIFPILLL